MNDKPFVDTNVLVYAVEAEGSHSEKALLASALLQSQKFCLSTQVLSEFYTAVTQPRRPVPLTHEEAVAWVDLWKRHEVHAIAVPNVSLALDWRARFNIGYFDALILATAHLAGCTVVYSEDLNDGQDYSGVRVDNPFRGLPPR